MRLRLWLAGTGALLGVGLANNNVMEVTLPTTSSWTIGVFSLVALVGIELGIAGRGFADPEVCTADVRR